MYKLVDYYDKHGNKIEPSWWWSYLPWFGDPQGWGAGIGDSPDFWQTWALQRCILQKQGDGEWMFTNNYVYFPMEIMGLDY